ELKKAKNDFYRGLEEAFTAAIASRAAEVRLAPGGGGPDGDDTGKPLGEGSSSFGPADMRMLARRELISPKNAGLIPFASKGAQGIRAEPPASINGISFVPLPPVMMDDGQWLESLERLAGENPGIRFAIGLNNVGHLGFVDSLAARKNVVFFVDFSLYVANRFALGLLSRRVPRLAFAYSWIEDTVEWQTVLPVPIIRIAPGFRPPLFSSLGCFAKHVLNSGSCPDESPRAEGQKGCPRDEGVPPRFLTRALPGAEQVPGGRERLRVVSFRRSLTPQPESVPYPWEGKRKWRNARCVRTRSSPCWAKRLFSRRSEKRSLC
ncbi:MAG: hypothetical protein NT005_00045, partial [Spirochaetes bacterium]|nr:hypothetical protein [Spirochaetota bacterium]